jgi:two-component system, OmpR family, sensor histidine kinase KdpD
MSSWLALAKRPRPPLNAYLQVVGLVGCTVLAGVVIRSLVPLESVTALLLLPVVGAAIFWGFECAMLAAVLAIACGIPFYEPVLTFVLRHNSDIVDLTIFAVVAVVVSYLGEALRQRTSALEKRQEELEYLYRLSHEIAAAPDARTILQIVAKHLSAALGRPVDLLTREELAQDAASSTFSEEIRETARSMFQAGSRPRVVVSMSGRETWLVASIGTVDEEGVAVAANLGRLDGSEPAALDEAISILNEGASSLERLGLARALDDRRLREKIDEGRTALFDSASHELRTPLAAIQGAVTALQNVPEVASQEKLATMLDFAVSECGRLNMVIQNMLDEGRIRSGHLVARFEVVELAEILRDALGQAQFRLDAHQLEISLPETGPFVEVDPHLVGQALINILENAAKFSAEGSTIKVALDVRDASVAIHVKDEGCGLSPEEAAHAFERFYRGAGGGDGRVGSGLGLSVARAFVEASNGHILVESPGPGLGASFTLTFPIAHPECGPNADD